MPEVDIKTGNKDLDLSFFLSKLPSQLKSGFSVCDQVPHNQPQNSVAVTKYRTHQFRKYRKYLPVQTRHDLGVL